MTTFVILITLLCAEMQNKKWFDHFSLLNALNNNNKISQLESYTCNTSELK